MNHSKPYWQRAGEDNLQHIRLVGRAREIISCSHGNPPWMAVKHREVDIGEEGLSPGNASRMEDSLLEGNLVACCLSARRVRRSPTTVFLDRRLFGGLAELLGGIPDQQWWRGSDPPLCKPPTGFSESDVGEFIRSTSPSQSDDHLFGGPSDIECDVGRMLDELVSSELETTMLADDEVCNDSCLTMESTRFQLCQN